MKALIAVMDDGTSTLLSIVPSKFDTQTWANKRTKSFYLCHIVKIIEQDL